MSRYAEEAQKTIYAFKIGFITYKQARDLLEADAAKLGATAAEYKQTVMLLNECSLNK